MLRDLLRSDSDSDSSMGSLRLSLSSGSRSLSLLSSGSESTVSIPMRRIADFQWTEPTVISTKPKPKPKPKPRLKRVGPRLKREGPRNTYHCCNKKKKDNRGGTVCPGICPQFDLGPDGKLYCSWCIPKEWKKTSTTVSLQDWVKIKSNTKVSSRRLSHYPDLPDLVVKPSGIPGAGQGLFTLDPIKKNQKIIQYTGTIKTQAEYDANPSGYTALPFPQVG